MNSQCTGLDMFETQLFFSLQRWPIKVPVSLQVYAIFLGGCQRKSTDGSLPCVTALDW